MSLKISMNEKFADNKVEVDIIKYYKFEVETNYETVRNLATRLTQKLGIECSILNKRILIDEGVFIQTSIDPSIFIISFSIPFALLKLKDYRDIFLIIMEDYKENIVKLLN